MNLSTFLILLVLLALFSYIIYGMAKKKKEGKSNCSCGCESCALKDHCSKPEKPKS